MSCLCVSFAVGRCLFLGVKISTAQGWRVGTLGTTGSLPIELGTSQGVLKVGFFDKTPVREFISSIFGMLELPRILLGPIVFVAQRRNHGLVWQQQNISGQPEAVIAWLSLGGGGSKGWEKFFMVQVEETKPFKTKILVSYLG